MCAIVSIPAINNSNTEELSEKGTNHDETSNNEMITIDFEFSNAADEGSHEVWCIDSGCTAHMCGNRNSLTNFEKPTIGKVNLANKSSIDIAGRGSVSLNISSDGQTKRIDLKNTLHVPDLRTNLLSVGKMCDKELKVIFETDGASVIDRDGKIVLRADRVNGGLYYVQASLLESNSNAEWDVGTLKMSLAEIWHRRMGHVNYRDLQKYHREEAVKGMTVDKWKEDTRCEICIRGKMTKSPFPKKSERKSDILEIIHSDVCGPMRTESLGKSRYFVTFIDDASRWCEICFIRRKDEVFQAFKK